MAWLARPQRPRRVRCVSWHDPRCGYKTNGFLRLGIEVPSAPALTATARTFCDRDCVFCTAGGRFFEVAFRDVDRAFPGESWVIVSSPFGFPWPGLPQCCALHETGRSVR